MEPDGVRCREGPCMIIVEWGSPSVGNCLCSYSESKDGFAIKLETLIEAESKTGFLAKDCIFVVNH